MAIFNIKSTKVAGPLEAANGHSFSRNISAALLALVLQTQVSYIAQAVADPDQTSVSGTASGTAEAASQKTVKALPPQEQRETKFKSADDAVEHMYITTDIDVPTDLSDKLVSTPDYLKVEVDAIYELIADKSVANHDKELTFIRYTMGDERIDQALIDARKAGIPVQIVTDFNTSMNYDFQDGEKTTIDFKNAHIRSPNSPGGKSLSRLLAGGFKFGKDLTSQPIYNTKVVERTPIMHEKGLFTRAGKKFVSFIGTANGAPHSRVNRVLKFIDPAIYEAYAEHVSALVKNYAAGNETKELPQETRKVFEYADGTQIELAFTNGRDNPNQRALEPIKDMERFILSEFAPTNRSVIVSGIGEQMKNDRSITGLQVTDDKFTTTFGYGVTLVLDNVDVNSPFSPLHGLGEGVARRVDAFIWQKQSFDASTGETIFQTEDDGEPLDRELWHDKTMAIFTKTTFATKILNGLKKVFLYTGSFNLSNNVVNAENQLELQLPENSWIVRGTEYSIRQTIKQNPKYAIPYLDALLRNSMAKAFRLGVLDIQLSDVAALAEAVRSSDTNAIRQALIKIGDSPTHMRGALSKDEMQSRIDSLTDIMDWSFKTLPRWNNSDLIIKHMVNLALPLSDKNLGVGQRLTVLRGFVWRPNMTPEQQQNFVAEANERLGFAPIPARDGAGRTDNHNKADSTSEPGPQQEAKPGTGGRTEAADTHQPQNVPTPSGSSATAHSVPENDVTIFDFDNTIMTLATKIRIFKKGSEEFMDLSSAQFAKSRSAIREGRGVYADYEIRHPSKASKDNSFVYFEKAAKGANYFASDIATALASKNEAWMAPEFDLFIERLKNQATAERTYILTARNHSEAEYKAGLELIAAWVKEHRGLDITIPPAKNFIGVGYAQDVPKEKGLKILEIAKQWASMTSRLHFYDDDANNAKAAAEVTQAANIDVDVVHVVPQASQTPQDPSHHIAPGGHACPGALLPHAAGF